MLSMQVRHYSCDICGKGVQYGNLVSHAKNRTKHIRLPNLHNAKVLVGDVSIKMRLCTKCIQRAPRPHKVKLAAEAASKTASKK